MGKIQLVVEILARLDWIDPPANAAEQIVRAEASNKVADVAMRLEPAVKLLVEEMMMGHLPPNV